MLPRDSAGAASRDIIFLETGSVLALARYFT